MTRRALLLLALPFALLACSSDPIAGLGVPAPGGSSVTAPPGPSTTGTTPGADGGTLGEAGPNAPKPDGGSTTPGAGSGGTGGPGPGEHDLALVGTSVALHVPQVAAGTPTPLLILLHGQ